jgi:hypothetical protein
MFAKMSIERGAGLLLLLVAGATGLILTVGRLGIGAAEPYFQEDFPALARNPEPYFTGLILTVVLAIGLIAGAAALYRTFQPHGPALAAIGAFGLLAAGALLLVTGAAGRALIELAGEWRATGGGFGGPVWAAARAVALVYESLAGASFLLMLSSLAVFGALILRRGALPRWLGGLALLAGLGVVVGLGLAWVVEWFFWAFLGGLVAGLAWFLIAGAWLLARGTAPAARPDPA